MAYNFKSIADVEVVAEPTESANVLIEENGVIKRAPKTVVGGAIGGGSCDYYIFYENGKVTATDGIYEAIIKNLFNNLTGITVRIFNVDRESNSVYEDFKIQRFSYAGGDDAQITINCDQGMVFFIDKNGEHSYYWD